VSLPQLESLVRRHPLQRPAHQQRFPHVVAEHLHRAHAGQGIDTLVSRDARQVSDFPFDRVLRSHEPRVEAGERKEGEHVLAGRRRCFGFTLSRVDDFRGRIERSLSRHVPCLIVFRDARVFFGRLTERACFAAR